MNERMEIGNSHPHTLHVPRQNHMTHSDVKPHEFNVNGKQWKWKWNLWYLPFDRGIQQKCLAYVSNRFGTVPKWGVFCWFHRHMHLPAAALTFTSISFYVANLRLQGTLIGRQHSAPNKQIRTTKRLPQMNETRSNERNDRHWRVVWGAKLKLLLPLKPERNERDLTEERRIIFICVYVLVECTTYVLVQQHFTARGSRINLHPSVLLESVYDNIIIYM